jgi:hypothetical protein
MTSDEQIVEDIRRWLVRAVIGLNLCPFAKAPYSKGQIHYGVLRACGQEELRKQIGQELIDLARMDPAVRETSLLILPDQYPDFLEFNDFLEEAEAVLEELDLEGVLQIASFHPRFQFYGTRSEDITNATNRSPYPTLHLIRETSIDRAVAAFPEAETIFEANMQTLRDLGEAGWLGLDVGAHSQTEPGPPSPTGREIST